MALSSVETIVPASVVLAILPGLWDLEKFKDQDCFKNRQFYIVSLRSALSLDANEDDDIL